MKKEKMNDKGFSLVELIIVIAIMAVLIVVLAPQYLKYVERSRNSTDLQNATEIVTALQVYGSDPEATEAIPAEGSSVTVKVDTNDTATVTGDFAVAALKDAGLANASGDLTMRCQSKTTWTSYTITATSKNGGLEFSYSNEGGKGATAFADAMARKKGTTTTE